MINKWFEGVTHILYLHKNTIEGDRRKQNRRTNTNKLGVNQEQRKVCNTTCMCRLSLAWVTSENSTMLLESDSSWLTLAGPYPMLPLLSAPVSGVDSPVRSSTPTSAVRLPRCPATNCPLSVASSTALSALQPPTALSGLQPPTASLLSSRQLPSAGSRRQLPFASPYHFRIRRDFMSKNPLSGFAPKQTRLLWRPTHIVLHTTLSYPCHLFSINYNTI